MKNDFILVSAPKSDVKRLHSTGECFKNGKHMYYQRDNDVLHLNVEKFCLNSLFDNYLAEDDIKTNLTKISFDEFKTKLIEKLIDNDISELILNK